MHVSDRDYSRRTSALFMMMTGFFLLAIIYFSLSGPSMVKRASVSAFTQPRVEASASAVRSAVDTSGVHLHDAAHATSGSVDAEHTHGHSHGADVHTHSHPSAVHHD